MAPITMAKTLQLLKEVKTSAKTAVKETKLTKIGSEIKEGNIFARDVREVTSAEIEQMKTENAALYYALTDKQLPTIKKQQVRMLNAKMTENIMLNMAKYTKGYSIGALSQNFAAKKASLICEMEGIITPQQLNKIKHAKTPEELTNVIFAEEFSSYSELIKAGKSLPKGRILLAQEQMDYQARIQRGKYILAREKAMHVPSTNPQVIAIENILKEQYGVTFVSLKNDEKMAKKVLKAFETANKNGVKTPKRVIISDFMFAEGENIPTENMILLASSEAKENAVACSVKAMSELSASEKSTFQLMTAFPNSNPYSTTCAEHVPLHEIMHGTHPMLGAYGMQKIPASMTSAKENASLYSAISNTFETYTELATKKALVGLNEAETKLFDYLNFYA